MIRILLRETVHGYTFWSLFQGLVPMIWFYPLNQLEISGYESFAVFLLLPVITGISQLRMFLQNRWMMGILRTTCMVAIASFQAPTTFFRLIILACGTSCAVLVLTLVLWSPSPRIRSSSFWGLLLGLFTFLVGRVWFTSFIPTWWNNNMNSVVIAISAIAVFDQILSGSDHVEMSRQPKEQTYPLKSSWLLVGIGFGSFLFLTQWCFGEVSLITRWVVMGYPNHGPLPNPWGAPVLLALTLGVFLSEYKILVQSKIWWLYGAAGLLILYYLPTWYGYVGGLILGVCLFSMWPEMIDRLTSCPPARTMAIAMLIYILEMLFFVWTVAYNFVPRGEYTREHTDYLIIFILISIFLGLFIGKTTSSQTAFVSLKEGQPAAYSKKFFAMLLCLGLLGFAARFSPGGSKHPTKSHKSTRFTAMIWTYHFGYDNRGWPSLERSAELIQNTGADVVTLLESDASKSFLGNNDLGMWLGETLNMYVDFGPATKTHTWGNLLMSKYPIVKSTHHLLPSPHGELAPAITATVNISGHLVDFVVTHMGNDRDVLDRELQARFLSEELRQSANPAVFLGYITSLPGSHDYKQLINHGRMKDIDDTDRERWCEYIMYKKLIRLGYARITHGGLSDTEVQIAKFQIPENSKSFRDNDVMITDCQQVDKQQLFNSRFGKFYVGHGSFNTHRYHMSTPKYFLPEKSTLE